MAASPVAVDAKAAVALAVFLTVAAVFINDGTVAWIFGPTVFLLVIFAMTRVPLRYSLMGLMLCGFTLENPSEMPAGGAYRSPFFFVGALFLTHMNNPTGVKWLFVSGMDVFLGSLLVIGFLRRMSGSKMDTAGGAVATPKPLIRLAQLSLLGTVIAYVYGALRGGNSSMSLWQADRVVYLPTVFILFHWALRGPKDFAGLAKILLIAACLRSCFAVYIQATVTPPAHMVEGKLDYATSHHDSILFACAVVLILSLLLQRTGGWAIRLAILVLPIVTAGMIANDRRMVWVQVVLVFVTLYLATPINPMKRKIRKWLLIASPAILGYIAVGWRSDAGIFSPVASIRSVLDSESDASTQWRDIENYDLVFTFRHHPVLGTGYGHPFWEVIPLPPVGYPLEHYIPHNSVLGLWCYTGLLGFTCMTLLWVAAVYFAMRAYHITRVPLERTAALVSLGSVLVYWVQCYGDMGLGSWTGVFTVGPAIAVAGKLAVSVGAWSATKKRPEKVEQPAVAAPAPSPTQVSSV